LGARFAFHCILDAPVYFSAVFGKPVTGLFLLFSAVCSVRNIYFKSTGQAVRTALFFFESKEFI
jgi:hypothetical protein